VGDEARCVVRYGGRTSEGKALLETDELRFRGDFRLTVPLRAISSARAEGGRLDVAWEGEEASFEVGARAERWAERIRNPRTLLDKLGLKPSQRVSLVGIDDAELRRLLHEREIPFAEEPESESDAVLYRAESVGALDRLAELRERLKPDGAIWVVAPKGGREPREAQVLAAGRAAGLVDTKVARFSDTHTAHRFVIPRDRRS
jgi:Protein of unknown function (DUF3052)